MNSADKITTLTRGSTDDEFEEEDDDDEYYDDFLEDDDTLENTDFLGKVMEANVVDKSGTTFYDEHPPIKKIMKIFQKSDEDTEEKSDHDRTKREIIGETANGVPVLAESYLEARAKNLTYKSNQIISPPPYHHRREYTDQKPQMLLNWDLEQAPMELKRRQQNKLNMLTSTNAPSPIYTRSSRVMATDEDKSKSFRRVVMYRKPKTRVGLTSDHDAALLEMKPETIGMTKVHRLRKSHGPNRRTSENIEDVESFDTSSHRRRSRPPMVAHFNGNTADYSIEHEHYDGNGRLRHPHDVPYTAWSAAPWLSTMDIDTYFRLQDGSVSVPSSGLYFVYSQIYFHDAHDTNGFQVFRNNGVRDEAILQCTTMTHSTTTMEKSNTCYTAGAFHLNKGDTIFVKNLGSMRYSIMQAGKSFFGLFKLSDLRVR